MIGSSRARAACVGIVAAALLTPLLIGCDKPAEKSPQQGPPPAVTVTPVVNRDIAKQLDFVGRVVAVDKVDLMARVKGFLEKRLFDEGSNVKAGDLLFVIQPDEYRATVEQRRADLASAEARRQNTRAQLARAETLLKTKDIPEAEVDVRRAADATAAADILEAKAALQKAELDLSYTEIRAPVAGRIGRANYTIGNLVGPDSGSLATIVSQDPMYVTFPISERIFLEYQKQVADSGAEAKNTAVVRLVLGDGEPYPEPGKINFADNQVSQSTDTIIVRAAFPNPRGLLVDGQFATVAVEAGKPQEVPVVPENALQVDQAGIFVLLVDADNKVEVRRIETGAGRDGVIAVTKGLKAGEKVITEGALKVRPGQVVQPTEAPMPTAQRGVGR